MHFPVLRAIVGRFAASLGVLIVACNAMHAQSASVLAASPTSALRAKQLSTAELRTITLDGRLDEAAWRTADSISDLVQVEPDQGRTPTGRTVVRVLVSAEEIVIGVRADDPDPAHLVSFARDRDAVLTNEDHIKIVLDTYRDGRSGYVFAVNPNGARSLK